MPSYAERLKAHLAEYKRQALGISEDGVWAKTKSTYPHILPKDLQRLNILEPFRDEFWAYFEAHKPPIRLHRDFHHLNSSQALTFNLFYPFLSSEIGQTALLSALGHSADSATSWALEAVPDPEEGTNFDVLISLRSGGTVFIEVKLTEAGFGACLPDDAHKAKLATIYSKRLAGRVAPGALEEESFFPSYQLFRNASHVAPETRDEVILLVPRANGGLWTTGTIFCSDLLLPNLASAVRLISLESVLVALDDSLQASELRLRQQVDGLREKYLLPDAT